MSDDKGMIEFCTHIMREVKPLIPNKYYNKMIIDHLNSMNDIKEQMQFYKNIEATEQEKIEEYNKSNEIRWKANYVIYEKIVEH